MLLDVNHVSKRFTLREDRGDKFSNMIISFVRGRGAKPPRNLWAVRDLTFGLEHGRSCGIIGRNGSGKSTLLKLINGTMKPTEGSIRCSGRKSALIELGAGFHIDFSGRDNILLAGLIMGMTRSEVRKKFDDIVEFAELQEFIDVPIKYYSSGMQARLGFSVAIAVRPDLLIVDEVLAVGDAKFVEKCRQRILDLQREGVSVLLVSHNISDVLTLCNEAIWLEHGIARAHGPVDEVANAYQEFLRE